MKKNILQFKRAEMSTQVKVKAAIKAGSSVDTVRAVCLENAGDSLMKKEQCYSAFGFPF